MPAAPQVEVKWTPDPDAARRRRLAALLFGDRPSTPTPPPVDRPRP